MVTDSSFIRQLRGCDQDYMEKELKPLMVDIGLSSHITSTVAMLSGGMKRRLSLVVALIGPPKVNKEGSHSHKYMYFNNVLSH